MQGGRMACSRIPEIAEISENTITEWSTNELAFE
jgi:hypothetical protein